MGTKVSINTNEFYSAVSQVSSRGANLSMNISSNLTETDIEPFNTFSQFQEQLGSFLNEYQAILSKDMGAVTQIGKKMEETDKRMGAQ